MVHGSSPCGPTNLEAAYYAAFGFLGLWQPDQSYGPKVQIRYSAASLARLWSPSDGHNRQNPCRHLEGRHPQDRMGSLTNRGQPTSNNTVRLELALLSHLFTVAIQEWGLGLTYNPVLNIRKPSPGEGRNRRLTADEERRLLKEVNKHSNPMLGWIVSIALETGMRSSEITGLRRHQVDVKKRVARLLVTKNDSARTVPLRFCTKRDVANTAWNKPARPWRRSFSRACRSVSRSGGSLSASQTCVR